MSRLQSTAFLYGTTVAGDPGTRVNVGTRVQMQLPDLCYYTGVCVKKEWVDSPAVLEPLVYNHFNAQYSPPSGH